jgi:hypothetical protein
MTTELTVQDAIALASRESFVISPPYTPSASAVGDMIELRIACMRDGYAREFSMALSRQRTPADFAELSRKVWLWMHQEHEREHRLNQLAKDSGGS